MFVSVYFPYWNILLSLVVLRYTDWLTGRQHLDFFHFLFKDSLLRDEVGELALDIASFLEILGDYEDAGTSRLLSCCLFFLSFPFLHVLFFSISISSFYLS